MWWFLPKSNQVSLTKRCLNQASSYQYVLTLSPLLGDTDKALPCGVSPYHSKKVSSGLSYQQVVLVLFGSQLDRLKKISQLFLLILQVDWAQLDSSSAPYATGCAAVISGLHQQQQVVPSHIWCLGGGAGGVGPAGMLWWWVLSLSLSM